MPSAKICGRISSFARKVRGSISAARILNSYEMVIDADYYALTETCVISADKDFYQSTTGDNRKVVGVGKEEQ